MHTHAHDCLCAAHGAAHDAAILSGAWSFNYLMIVLLLVSVCGALLYFMFHKPARTAKTGCCSSTPNSQKRRSHAHADSHDHSGGVMHTSIREELLCHFPYAVVAVVLSLALLSLLGYGSPDKGSASELFGIFHTFHFMHIIFAATGVVVAYRRYAKDMLGALIVGTVVPLVFCTLSDAIMPYLGGRMCGLDMRFHWCLTDHFSTIMLFLFIGVINGYVVSVHKEETGLFSSHMSHFIHIFISAFASALYLVASGFTAWSAHIGFVFLYLLVAVLVPCTLADVVVPLWCGMQRGGANEEHTL